MRAYVHACMPARRRYSLSGLPSTFRVVSTLTLKRICEERLWKRTINHGRDKKPNKMSTKLNKEDIIDRNRWRKLIKDV